MQKVILLHGLGRSVVSMRLIAWRLGKAGFDPIMLDYPSTDASINHLVDHLMVALPHGEKLDFVGHSLGGILAKRLMRRLPPEEQGRIVQLAAPNFGSEIAARASVFGQIMGPALEELQPNEGDDDTGLDIGAIAGTAALPAYTLITGIEGQNDGKVSVESAWGGAPEGKRLAFPLTHSLMTLDKRVIKATIDFLKNGKFNPQPSVVQSNSNR